MWLMHDSCWLLVDVIKYLVYAAYYIYGEGRSRVRVDCLVTVNRVDELISQCFG